jgi:hypothetical protein
MAWTKSGNKMAEILEASLRDVAIAWAAEFFLHS